MSFARKAKLVSLLWGFGLCSVALAESPIIQTYYSPDPAPVVFGDTVCVYTGNDEGGHFFTMNGWRVSCSTDMVNWTDRGTLILSARDFSNAKENSDWAAQVIRRNGKYYYYVTVESSIPGHGGRAINVAVADKPEGPFKNALSGDDFLAGPHWNYIDPTVFIDDDDQAYLYWGNPKLYWAKLNKDMISFVDGVHETDMSHGFSPSGESVYTEGPWIHKRGKKYYMLYASHGTNGGEKISYSTSDSPMGPWTWGGIIMEPSQGSAFTNHCGIIDFKGRSFFFYHNQKNVYGGGYSRSTAIEEFTWNADGSIPTIKATDNGVVKPIKNLNPYERVEAETKSWVGGIKVDLVPDPDPAGGNFTIINQVAKDGSIVYLTNMGSDFYTKVRSVDMGEGADKITICTKGNGGKLEVHAESTTGTLLASIDVPASSSWKESTYKVSNATGVSDLYFVVKQAGFDFDYWYMESDKAPVLQTPYKDTIAIPGKIEAENYDVGGHNKSFFDKDADNQGGAYRQDEVDVIGFGCSDESNTKDCEGYAIGYTQEDEWTEYTINVAADAKYAITVNVATPFETAGFQLFIDDNPITEAIANLKTDEEKFNVYKEFELDSVELKKGTHVLKLLITGDYLNVDWIQFANQNVKPVSSDSKKNPDNAMGFIRFSTSSESSYNVFGVTGKLLGRINHAGANLSEFLRQSGYTKGVYIVRSLDHSQTFRINVR